MSILIPHAEKYLDAGMNVLLIGPHGTGKTESILTLCKAKAVKFKYFSCATLDPWTDLVGVPFPKETGEDRRELEMVRPRTINEAEFIFFDELNRADQKTLSAVFEIIQFKTINGEPLPNLRTCWAAINPPGEDYQVEDLDPALLDRFQAYIPVAPRPSVAYMSKIFPEPIAQALKAWWDGHDRKRTDNESYVSPRCLVDIGRVFMVTGQVAPALPPFGTFDTSKLDNMLREAKEKCDDTWVAPTSAGIGDGVADFDYTPQGLTRDKDKVVQFLTDNQAALDTHRRVLKALESVSAEKLATEHGAVLSALMPSLLEGFFRSFTANKRQRLEGAFRQAARDGQAAEVAKPFKALTGNNLPSI